MHNGCLLLLAFVAVFQPIASYTERGLVDGRQQRCEYRTPAHDPGLNFHGTYRFAKPAVEDRRLNTRKNIGDVHRNEVREDSIRPAPYPDRRLANTLERDRDTLKGPSRTRIGNDNVLRREVRLSSSRDERNQEIRRERVTRLQGTHQARYPTRREHYKRAENKNRYQRTDDRSVNEHRYSVVSRRDSRINENNAEAQRVGENREMRAATNRVRDNVASGLNERQLTRVVQRMDTKRSASRIQLEGNTDREIVDLSSRNMELRTATYRNRVTETSRMATREETTSLGRDDRRISSRRSVDERRQLRDVSRIRLTAARVKTPESTIRMTVRGLQDRTSQNLLEARLFERARSTASGRSENTARLIRAARLVDNRVSQDDSGSRKFAREISAENRRNVRDVQSVDRFRALERSTEHQKDSRSSDRALVLEIRNIETRRDNRNVLRDSSEVRGDTRDSNRNTCVYNRERSLEQRMTRLARDRSQENRRVSRNVESRATTERINDRLVTRDVDVRSFITERASQDRRDTRNHVESRSFRNERTDESRRDNRNLEARAFRTKRTERIREVDSRLLRTEPAEESRRKVRTIGVPFRTERFESLLADGFRDLRTERVTDSRRNIQDFERQSQSLDRDTDYRRDSRNVREARLNERAPENRRNSRTTESRAENERVVSLRRVVRSLERENRSIGRESTIENRLNVRMVDQDSVFERRPVDRRERATESRRTAQSTPYEFRGLQTEERKKLEARGINMVRSRDDLSQRNAGRSIERLSKRDSLDRHSYTRNQESQRNTPRTSERDNPAASLRDTEARNGFKDFARKREFQTMFKNPTHTENETPTRNWQYIFYTVQAIYIGGLLMQLNKRSADKKSRVTWWSAPQHLVKAE